jgi:hypothetical protein
LDKNCKKFGINEIQMNDIRQGIVHVIGPEQGATLPGMSIVCGDSHTSTGLCGQLRFDNQAVVQTDLQAMMQKIARRGPDDNGVWLDKTMGFGHRRLSIIDLSNHAHQPMVDEN